MSVTLEAGDGTTTEYTWVTTRMGRVEFDALTYRGATGTAWRATGTETQERLPMTLSIETDFVSADVDTLLTNLGNAVAVGTPFGAWRLAGVSSITEQPIQRGYRIDVELELVNPRYATLSDVLRLIDGEIWELR